MLLKTSQVSEENTGVEVCFNKVAGNWPATLIKINSSADVFLWNLWNFWEHLFWRTSANDCFCTCYYEKFFHITINCLPIPFVVLWNLRARMNWHNYFGRNILVFQIDQSIQNSWYCFYFDLLLVHESFKNLGTMVFL